MSHREPWMKNFVSQCVASITDPTYRRRLEGELADHLEELAANLEKSGLRPDEARERALEEMGDPKELREAYRQGGAGWRAAMSLPCSCWDWQAFAMTVEHIPFRDILEGFSCMEGCCF